MTNLFIKGKTNKRYSIKGIIDSNMTKEEISSILDLLGFYMFSIEETR